MQREVREPDALRRRRRPASRDTDPKCPSAPAADATPRQRRSAARTHRANQIKDSDSDAPGDDEQFVGAAAGDCPDPYCSSDAADCVEGVPGMASDVLADLVAQLSAGAGAGAGVGGEGDAFYASSQQPPEEPSSRLRKARPLQWAAELPLSMRRFVRKAANNVALRIYCDVAIRLPMLNANPDEVLNMCEQYGDVEYVSKLDNPNSGDGGTAISAVGGGCAHLIRFADGMDAVRCFISLNGSVVDPVKYNAAVEQLAMLAAGNSTGDPEAEEELLSSPDVLSEGSSTRLFNPNDFVIASADKCNKTALIFVTVDFFRMGLSAPAPCGGTVARSRLFSGHTDRPHNRGARHVPPIDWLIEHLSSQAIELAELYPAIASYDNCPWEKFCLASNLVAFLHTVPSPDAFRSLVQRYGHVLQPTEWEPSALSVAHEGLRRVNFDIEGLVRLIDRSKSALDIITGTENKPSRREKVTQMLMDVMRNNIVAAVALSCIMLLLMLLIWLVISPVVLSP